MQDEDWYLHYGLDRDPFEGTGVEGLFYPGGARQETVEQLQHLARFGDSVLLVSGAAGAGKSATLAQFVARCEPDTRCALVEVALLDGPEQILRRILWEFGIRGEADAGLVRDLQQLESFCQRCAAEGVLTWLVFDDAQHLHEDALTLLAPLLERSAGRLRLVFFAEPPWQAVLRHSLPSAAKLHVIDLSSFDRDGTCAYIHYRMKTAGLDADPPFTSAELDEIHVRSAGMPGRIDALARQVLIEALQDEEQPLSRLPVWHLGVVVLTLAALAFLYVWNEFDGDGRGQGQLPSAPTQGAGRASEAEPVIVTEEPAQASSPANAGGAPGGGDEASVDAEVAEEVNGVETGPVAQERPLPIEAPTPPRPPAPSAPPAAPQAGPAPAPPSAEQAPVRADPSRSAAEAGERAERSVQTRPRTATPIAGDSADEQYLLGLSPSLYVLQLISSSDQARVRALAVRLGPAARQYRKLHRGGTWFSLAYGEYAAAADAERAARDLAERLQGAQPWVRRAGDVQAEIRAARGG